ncbi:MAG: HlyD family efflux transporter periplasmic adaptor subunit [Desulfomonile tiedjei]|nr:HlyD family efflux transporter periplasmic adaptor subunit [Desulfomonile tiedjei]
MGSVDGHSEGRLTFRRDLEVSRYDDRKDRRTLVVRDPVSAKFYYLSGYEYRLLEGFDGTLTLEEVLVTLSRNGYHYTPEDAQAILGRAAQSGLLLGTKYGTAQYQKELKQRIDAARKAQRFSSVYFLFIPLFNPDRFLEKTLRFVRLVVNRWTLTLLALAAPVALYLLLSDSARLGREYLFFFNLENLLYLWIMLALTKLIHELAHAYTAKSFGIRVPDMGVAFLIFFPCLYCNTTDAWQLGDRRQRMLISLAGILAEAALATIAVFVWYFSKPGIVNSLAFYLMAISLISTVLFNGNPLMRFDGYFVLMDLLRLPNLYTRSLGHIRYLFSNRVLGIQQAATTATTFREQTIFTVYGVSAFLYRIFLYSSIVIGVYYRFDKLVGFALGVMAFALFIVRPLVRSAKSVFLQRGQIEVQRTGALCLGALVAIIVIVLLVPVQRKSTFPCYLASAKSQKLTVPLHTAVDQVFVEEGSPVKAGQILFTLDTNRLGNVVFQKTLESERVKRELEFVALDPKEMAWASGKEIQLRKAQDQTNRILRDLTIAADGIAAPFDGVVTRLDYRVQHGYQPGEGVVVGEVESPTDCLVHVLIPEDDLHRIKQGDQGTVWFRRRTGESFPGVVSEVRPYSEKDLRDSPFSSRFGGDVATEAREDQRTDVPLDAQYLGLVSLSNTSGIPLGMTGKFFLSSAPRSLAGRAFDRIAREFHRERLF